MTDTNTWARRIQGATLLTAEAMGERWTRDEIEYVVANTDVVSDETLALTLGRSLYAIWSIQMRIRHEGVAGVMPRTVEGQRPLSTRTYTFVGDDVPADW